jgi:hypothetical protein
VTAGSASKSLEPWRHLLVGFRAFGQLDRESMNKVGSKYWQSPWEGFHKLWSAMTGRRTSPSEVIVYDTDTDSSKPHDLDDPFYDREVQKRVGEAIAKAAQKSKEEKSKG